MWMPIMAGALKWMPTVSGISFWALVLLESVAPRLVFLAIFPVRFLFPKHFFLESWTEHLFLCVHFFWVVFHSTLVLCIQFPLFLLPFPSDLPLVAAAPEVGFSSCPSRQEKCFSRTSCSKYRTTIFLGLVSRFAFLKTILNVQRKQRLLS